MHICFITHDLHPQTGIGVFSRNLIERMARRHPDWRISVVVEKSAGHPLETRTMLMSKLGLFKTIWRLRGFLRSCDIIHAFDGFPYGLAAVISTLGWRKKIFITFIGSGSVRPLTRPFLNLLMRFGYKRTDTLFAISRYTARKVQHFMPTLKIIPINLGINAEEQKIRASDAVFLKQVAGKKPYLLTVGSFKPRKGQRQIAEGYIEVVKKIPELNYVLEGDWRNTYGDEIKQLIEEAGLARKVFFLGSISKDELRVFYNNAALFAMLPQEVPGDFDIEGFGLVFLDAAAAGLPIIASTEGPSAEAVDAGENALLVDPHDIPAIRDAIVRIYTDEELRKKMSRASVLFARQMSWDRMVDAYMPFYESDTKKS